MTDQKDQIQILEEMLELSIKAGRRMYHDYKHMLDEISEDNRFKEDFRERGKIWHSIFYPDNGMKNYRAELHREIEHLEWENRDLKKKLVEQGKDPNDDLPY
jgi:hypothetical protein